MYLIRACGTAHLERRTRDVDGKCISCCALDLRDGLRYTRPGHRKPNTNLLWWTGRCTRASRCSRWFTEFGPGERAIIDVGPESSRWFDDSVRLLVPTSVSLSEPSVSYSSDSDLNDFDLRRARPRTFVYWSTSHCNRFAVWNFLRETYQRNAWRTILLQCYFLNILVKYGITGASITFDCKILTKRKVN